MQHNFVLKFDPTFPTHDSLTFPKLSPHYIPTSPTVPPHYSPTLPNLSPYSTFPPCHSTPVIHLSHLPSSLLSHLSQLTSLPATNRHLQNSSLLSLSRQGKHARLIVRRPLMKAGWWDAHRSNQHHRGFTISNIEKSALPGNDYGQSKRLPVLLPITPLKHISYDSPKTSYTQHKIPVAGPYSQHPSLQPCNIILS